MRKRVLTVLLGASLGLRADLATPPAGAQESPGEIAAGDEASAPEETAEPLDEQAGEEEGAVQEEERADEEVTSSGDEEEVVEEEEEASAATETPAEGPQHQPAPGEAVQTAGDAAQTTSASSPYDEALAVLRRKILEVSNGYLPDSALAPERSLTQLGLNSVDRAEVFMLTLEELGIQGSLREVAGVKNIGELARWLAARRQQRP